MSKTTKRANANRIRLIRKILGMTQKEFAKELGVQPLATTRWESGHQVPNEYNMRKVERLVGKNNLYKLDILVKDIATRDARQAVSSEIKKLKKKGE
ncbi:helix-turn-helix domain-containing protein [Bacillus sp. TH22]|uniref:helix-turn-helix domain-containing protein n=1 Tax=unclassified Bacillus (in: firmicutes) TaxID=185979 RepID=UPI001911523C|nr:MULTISPECIES: helix-turn-helix domain-containing protein [unclassified Bacillus (in: firmicutes)]MBK5450909.1 helix-turn-helix domain-containing protein [Bacillus sp. TH22]MBK5455349.1 helix-turn-helix domain-containing protein [Bacillus sp. TH23]